MRPQSVDAPVDTAAHSNRRQFLRRVAWAGTLTGAAPGLQAADSRPPGPRGHAASTGLDDRRYWVQVAERLALPVLGTLAARQLKARMPVEERPGAQQRRQVSHLEAFGRLLNGIAPWLAVPDLDVGEARRRDKLLKLAQVALEAATDPSSPDFLNFNQYGQPLVDAAFLAQAILRAPRPLWQDLAPRVREHLVAALKSSRAIQPGASNWVMFSATVEAALLMMGETPVEKRLLETVRQMTSWYKGDGWYGDGPLFHFDYYNSFVIHPMLLDVLGVLRERDQDFARTYTVELERAKRYAAIQERLIAPDGTYPVVGRSITYRCGAFQALAQIALKQELPASIAPAQVRGALTAVIRRTLEAPGTWDQGGWLRIGLAGHQPGLGESYISTGSLYLASFVLLPLGLPPADPFWTAPGRKWTSQRVWTGEDLEADHALRDTADLRLPERLK